MPGSSEFTVLSTEEHYKGWAIDVRTDTLSLPDGEVVRRDVIAHPGAVAVVALDVAEQVVMVRQYRHPIRQFLLELPAGLLDVAGEQALAAAQRELYEEAALRAEQWHVLLDLHTSPGMSDEAIRVYLARGLTPVAAADRFQTEHEERTMTVERFGLTELAAAALSGELTNGPAVAGILAAELSRCAGWSSLRPPDSPWPARPALAPPPEATAL
jgi:8-oxo-dGTP pyrophosphatase MutT (NUDIX family)